MKTKWSLLYLRFKIISIFIIILCSFILACNTKKETNDQVQESTMEKDPYTENLKQWLAKEDTVFSKYVVMQYGACNYCDNKIKQALLNLNCLTKNRSLSFILHTSKRLPHSLAALVEPNLCHYKETVRLPFLEEFPRIYTVQRTDKGTYKVTYEWYSAEGFAEQLELLCKLKINSIYTSMNVSNMRGVPLPMEPYFMVEDTLFGYSVEQFESRSDFFLLEKNLISLTHD